MIRSWQRREVSAGVVEQPGRLHWDLGVLRMQERVEIQVEFDCPLPTHETCIVAELSAADLPTESRRVTLQVEDEPDLNVAVQDEHDVIRPGDVATYTIVIRNRGLEPVQNVQLLTDLSEHLLLSGVTVLHPGQERAFPAQPVNSKVTPLPIRVIPEIPPDGVVTVRVTAFALRTGVAQVRARVAAAAQHVATEEFTVILPSG